MSKIPSLKNTIHSFNFLDNKTVYWFDIPCDGDSFESIPIALQHGQYYTDEEIDMAGKSFNNIKDAMISAFLNKENLLITEKDIDNLIYEFNSQKKSTDDNIPISNIQKIVKKHIQAPNEESNDYHLNQTLDNISTSRLLIDIIKSKAQEHGHQSGPIGFYMLSARGYFMKIMNSVCFYKFDKNINIDLYNNLKNEADKLHDIFNSWDDNARAKNNAKKTDGEPYYDLIETGFTNIVNLIHQYNKKDYLVGDEIKISKNNTVSFGRAVVLDKKFIDIRRTMKVRRESHPISYKIKFDILLNGKVVGNCIGGYLSEKYFSDTYKFKIYMDEKNKNSIRAFNVTGRNNVSSLIAKTIDQCIDNNLFKSNQSLTKKTENSNGR